jgi:exodeoxyribonuclease VII large subunit
MRGRHVADLSHLLARTVAGLVAVRERQVQQLRRRLERSELGRRLADIRTRLVSADGRLDGAVRRAYHRADAQLRDGARRLETLSPLAVLGRGYAVCWNADRSRVVRDASTTEVGDRVRITLAAGELECDVRGRTN